MATHKTGFLELVQSIKPRIQETNIEKVKTQLDNSPSCYLVDVRETEEWQKGRIPKAMHLSKGIIERDIEKYIADKEAEIVLYCGGGFRSALAAYNLQKMGYTRVYSMDGGYRAWQQAGYPTQT
jgi:rhodanese-related sulfurtransferase